MMGIAEPEGPRAAEELSFPFGVARIPSCCGRRGELCRLGEALLAALGPASHVEQRHAVLVANAPCRRARGSPRGPSHASRASSCPGAERPRLLRPPLQRNDSLFLVLGTGFAACDFLQRQYVVRRGSCATSRLLFPSRRVVSNATEQF